MNELLPCPFCESNKITIIEACGEAWALCLTCKGHGCACSSGVRMGASEHAERVWNNRSNLDAAVKEAEQRAWIAARTHHPMAITISNYKYETIEDWRREREKK